MLPDLYREPYTVFQSQLEQLQQNIGQVSPDPRALQTQFLETQRCFQDRILSLNEEALAPEVSGKIQSIQTEINKQLRLLAMDVLFLQSARQSATAQQRQKQMGDRLQLLRQYCEAVLGESNRE